MKIRPWSLIIWTGIIAPILLTIVQFIKPSTNDFENFPALVGLPFTLGIAAGVYAIFAALVKSQRAREFVAVLISLLTTFIYVLGILVRLTR